MYMKNIYVMKLSLCFTAVLLLTSFLPEKAEAKIELIDRVIAVVDSGVIMESELNQRVQDIIGRLRSEGTELPPKDLLEEQVLISLLVNLRSFQFLVQKSLYLPLPCLAELFE